MRVNWNNTEYLSQVKDQGQCGSCYAFSTTNVLETFMRINNFTVDRLSEQQIVDCSPNDYGCHGGFMHTSLDFIIDNKGLLSNEYYQYMGKTQNCTISKIQQNFGSLCNKKVSLSIILPEHPSMYLYQIAAKSLPQEEF